MERDAVVNVGFDPGRFMKVYKFLLGTATDGNPFETVLLAMVLAEVCWRVFSEQAAEHCDNLGEFRAEMKLEAVKMAEHVFEAH